MPITPPGRAAGRNTRLALLGLVFVCSPIQAAESDTPAPLRELGEDQAAFSDFEYSPNASLAYEYNDNIFATEAGELSDSILRASAAGNMASRWKRHALKAGAGVTVARYIDYDSENTTDYWAKLSGRRDLDADSNLFGGLSYSRLHEVRGSIDAVSGDEPTIYYKGQANAGLKQGLGDFSLTLAGSFNNLDYRNTPAGGSELFNDDRDRNESSLGVRVNYALAGNWSLIAQLRTDVRDYELSIDDAGYARSSTGYRVGIGARLDRGERLQAELMVGYLTQDYDDAAFDDVDALDYQGSLNWYVSTDSHLRIELAHSLEETTVPGSPGYLYRQIGAQWRQRYTAKLFGKFGLAYGQADYQQNPIEDDYYDATAGITYAMRKGFLAGVELRRLQRDSNQPGDDFKRNVLSVSLSGRF